MAFFCMFLYVFRLIEAKSKRKSKKIINAEKISQQERSDF